MFRFQIRGVEVGIVVLVLIVWAGAIALFFNRWGKIRMLLPYQPDYKEQLKVPGTGVCTAANSAYTQHPTQHACSQVTHRYTAYTSPRIRRGGCEIPSPNREMQNRTRGVRFFSFFFPKVRTEAKPELEGLIQELID